MIKYTREELEEALKLISSVISRCEKAQVKFNEGSAQHSLLKNRIKAMYISKALITHDDPISQYTSKELADALPPVVSIISKCEKAQLKFAEGSSNHKRSMEMIKAMKLSEALIAEELSKRGTKQISDQIYYGKESLIMKESKILQAEQVNEILGILKARFDKYMERHKELQWEPIQARLEVNKEKLWSLYEMERTGGEPDVVGYDENTGEYIFYDCSPESPKERRSICYDQEALNSRKENKPKNSALQMAADMGIEVLTEDQYRELQSLGRYDLKTSSWVKTPDHIRKLGGAIFCDCRYDTVFTYHNGAESYYAARGFRGCLRV